MTTPASQSPLRVVIVGHVDHGKSSLVGRLLHETGSLPEGKFEAIRAMSERRGMPFEWAFAMDAFQAERDQAITIDAAHIWFKSRHRPYVIVDAPGHAEFVKNMVSGAAGADAAVLVIDAAEGVREQSRRHGLLLSLLGVGALIVAVNKMDLIGFDRVRFEAVAETMRAYLAGLHLSPSAIVPVSARGGDNLTARSVAMPWYQGPSLVEALDQLRPPPALTERPFRLPVQDVYHFDQRRIISGRIESGRLKVGDRVLFSPLNKSALVASIEAWNVPAPMLEAEAGQSIGFTLDDQLFIERGALASHPDDPPIETNVFRARVFWLGAAPLSAGRRYKLKLGTREERVEVHAVERLVEIADLSQRQAAEGAALELARNAIGEVVLRSSAMLALDEHASNPRTGRFVLIDGFEIAGGGLIDMKGYPDQRAAITNRATNIQAIGHRLSSVARAQRNAHRGGVVWLTGLSGAGKSTLALEAEAVLFAKGYQVYLLDGDNVRSGLNANLGFSPEERTENVRRVGEVAALFADAGLIAITAFISPYRADRERARDAAARSGEGSFHEVFVNASLAQCEARDPKGLYKRARAGQIAEFTGVSAPYELPDAPALVIDTANEPVAASVQRLVSYIEGAFKLER